MSDRETVTVHVWQGGRLDSYDDLLEEGESLNGSLDDLKNEYLVTGEEITVEGTDTAFYDEVDNVSMLAIRDANAIGLIVAAPMQGLSPAPDRVTALDAADALVAHWSDS